MSAYINRVTLLGNVGRDPEIRQSNQGTPCANFSVATTESWKDGDEKKERTTWTRIEAWGRVAEIVQDMVQKGTRVLVEGSLREDEWTDKDGNKRKTTKVNIGGPQGRLVVLSNGKRRDESHASVGQRPDGPEISDDDVPF